VASEDADDAVAGSDDAFLASFFGPGDRRGGGGFVTTAGATWLRVEIS